MCCLVQNDGKLYIGGLFDDELFVVAVDFSCTEKVPCLFDDVAVVVAVFLEVVFIKPIPGFDVIFECVSEIVLDADESFVAGFGFPECFAFEDVGNVVGGEFDFYAVRVGGEGGVVFCVSFCGFTGGAVCHVFPSFGLWVLA